VVDGSDVIMELGGNNYHLELPYEDNYSVTVGENMSGRIIVSHGTIFSRDVSIGQFADSFGSLLLGGEDAAWTTSYDGNWHGVQFGGEGDAHLLFLNGAHFNHGHGNSAWGTESNVLFDVSGSGAEWYVDGQFEMSNYGDTTVNIANGGLVDIGLLTMAYYPGSSAQINITGQDHLSELQLHSFWQTSLIVGKNGRAGIRVDGSKVWNQGSMILGENLGSTGMLEIHEGSWVDCLGSVAIGGSLDGIGRVSIIDDDRSNETGVDFTPTSAEGQSMLVWPQGTITMDGGVIEMEYADWTANPIILQGGTLKGSGMIWAHVENHGGIVNPSDDQDQKLLEIGYNYTQDARGTLKIAIAGRDPVSQYAHLRVTSESYGQVSLDGMLDVDLIDGFIPNYEDEFTIIAAQTISGTFSNASSRYVFEDGSFEVIYNTDSYDSVILTHYSSEPACPKNPLADLNKDCTVDLADFAIFASEWLECNLVPNSYCFGGPIIL
jgi:hypothetical protein